MIEKVLVRRGYQLTTVDNGEAAWDALQVGSFDLLITDNDMPKLTGIELVTRIRGSHLALPIILASGSAGYYAGEEFRHLGFSACLQKPFPLDELLEATAVALS